MSDRPRCQARSTLNDAQCALPLGHPGRHSILDLSTDRDLSDEELWREPEEQEPLTFEELLEHVRDVQLLAASEGFNRLARTLEAFCTSIRADRDHYDHREETPLDRPPGA